MNRQPKYTNIQILESLPVAQAGGIVLSQVTADILTVALSLWTYRRYAEKHLGPAFSGKAGKREQL